MKTIANIAFRNLNRQKKRSFLLGGAIAFGILIVTVINGFAGAFVENVAENFSHILAGHIFVEGVEKSSSGKDLDIIRDDTEILDALKAAGVPAKHITKRSAFRGTLIFEGKKVQQVIDGSDLSQETFLKERLVLKAGSWDSMSDPHAVILTDQVAKKLKVEVGDRVLVQMQTVTGQNNVGELVLAGISYDTGILGSMAAYANKAYVNELLDMEAGSYQSLSILLDDLRKADAEAEKLDAAFKAAGLQVFDRKAAAEKANRNSNTVMQMLNQAKKETWTGVKYRLYTLNDMLSQVQQIVNVLQGASFIILLILFLIIMVGITNTFRMILYERIKEIGTMRALGMQRGEVRNLFILEALFLALGGAVAGIALAALVMGGLSLIDWGMDTPMFLLLKNGHMSFRVPPVQLIGNILLISILTVLAAFMPARKAAKLTPAEALRTSK